MFYLSAFIFIPLIGALVIACFADDNKRLIHTTAVIFSSIPLVISSIPYNNGISSSLAYLGIWSL